MKSKYIALGLLFLTSLSYGASDRFGNWRSEVPRSSYTTGNEQNVFIASVTQPNVDFASMTPTSGGSLIIRSVIFSGIVSSTITFYDGGIFDGNITTKTVLNYVPIIGTVVGGIGGVPIKVDLDMYVSTSVAYSKIGLAPITIKWDWLSPRLSGDPRN